jgi:hypothetical protein
MAKAFPSFARVPLLLVVLAGLGPPSRCSCRRHSVRKPSGNGGSVMNRHMNHHMGEDGPGAQICELVAGQVCECCDAHPSSLLSIK